MCLQRQSARKRPSTCDSSHRYNFRTRLSTPSRVSQSSPPAPPARRPTAKQLRLASISSISSLSSIFTTPRSLPSTPALPEQSHSLEYEIKTANNKIANLADFLSDELRTSRKECDEIAIEAERLKELVAHHSSEVTRLQALHTTLRRTWEESILCAMCREPCTRPYLIQECKHMFCLACLQQWFAECLRKDLESVDLPPRLEARRDPPYTAETLEEFYAAGVVYTGLSYTCPFCRARVWEKPKEERALTCVISAVAAALGPAVQNDTNDDEDPDVWAGIFLRT
ncbi:hypothetical protein EDD15DRAFT_2359549 [Pisolithus albus]|nr:hypothetical protein EDD15DRAFT_2359549 [Pisolithus albus]